MVSPIRTSPRIRAAFSIGWAIPTAVSAIDRAGATAIDFGVYGVPETYVIDGTGHVRYRHVGPLTAEEINSKILPLIERLTAAGGAAGASGKSG